MSILLAGDIGGTKTVVSLFERAGDSLRTLREDVFESAAHARFDEILSAFLADASPGPIAAACFGVAGAVMDGRAQTTNLPWSLDEGEISRGTGIPRVRLLNDLEASAYGMLALRPDQRAVLNPGAKGARGHIAVIAAGTGLGEALLYWDGDRHRAVASEGGHAGFAPRSEEEIELLRFMRADLGGRVSTERVLSGPGLHNVYRFVRESGGEPEPHWLAERMRSEDPSAVIGSVGVEGGDPACVRALELFTSIYGSEAGNMALRYLAFGGVVVGGGIAPKILPVLEAGGFVEAFTDKGRFSDMLRGIQVSVALEPRAPVLGAARIAAGL